MCNMCICHHWLKTGSQAGSCLKLTVVVLWAQRRCHLLVDPSAGAVCSRWFVSHHTCHHAPWWTTKSPNVSHEKIRRNQSTRLHSSPIVSDRPKESRRSLSKSREAKREAKLPPKLPPKLPLQLQPLLDQLSVGRFTYDLSRWSQLWSFGVLRVPLGSLRAVVVQQPLTCTALQRLPLFQSQLRNAAQCCAPASSATFSQSARALGT